MCNPHTPFETLENAGKTDKKWTKMINDIKEGKIRNPIDEYSQLEEASKDSQSKFSKPFELGMLDYVRQKIKHPFYLVIDTYRRKTSRTRY